MTANETAAMLASRSQAFVAAFLRALRGPSAPPSTLPRIAWHCESCGAEGEMVVGPDMGAIESAKMVQAAHAVASPDCRVEGSRRIRVRRVVATGGCGSCGRRRAV